MFLATSLKQRLACLPTCLPACPLACLPAPRPVCLQDAKTLLAQQRELQFALQEAQEEAAAAKAAAQENEVGEPAKGVPSLQTPLLVCRPAVL